MCVCVTGVNVCMSVLGNITHSLFICHLPIKLCCIGLSCEPGVGKSIVASPHVRMSCVSNSCLSASLNFFLFHLILSKDKVFRVLNCDSDFYLSFGNLYFAPI